MGFVRVKKTVTTSESVRYRPPRLKEVDKALYPAPLEGLSRCCSLSIHACCCPCCCRRSSTASCCSSTLARCNSCNCRRGRRSRGRCWACRRAGCLDGPGGWRPATGCSRRRCSTASAATRPQFQVRAAVPLQPPPGIQRARGDDARHRQAAEDGAQHDGNNVAVAARAASRVLPLQVDINWGRLGPGNGWT